MKILYTILLLLTGLLCFSQTVELATISGHPTAKVDPKKSSGANLYILLQYEADSEITILNKIEKGVYSKLYLSLFHRKDLYSYVEKLLKLKGKKQEEYSLKVAYYWYIDNKEHISNGLKSLKIGRLPGPLDNPYYISFEDATSRSNPKIKHKAGTIYLNSSEMESLKRALSSQYILKKVEEAE